MRIDELPEDTQFFDMDGRAVAVLPDATHVAFSPLGDGQSRPFPNHGQPGSDMGDLLSRDEFAEWLATGRNRFDC